MLDDYLDYPLYVQFVVYFQSYVWWFGLYDVIWFETIVVWCELVIGGGWEVESKKGDVEFCDRFDVLVVANGYYWKLCMLSYFGVFIGEFIHSYDYKCVEVFRGKWVFVIGGGNLVCDVVVEMVCCFDCDVIG